MLLMDELTNYRGHPKDLSIAVAFHDATLGWDAVSLQKESSKRLAVMSPTRRFV